MARIILTHEGAVLKEYNLSKERTTIGRKPGNDIKLDDPTVSGRHAVILMLQNAYIEDAGSTNGVILNGKKITRRQLNHGDIIRIGRHELKYIDDNAVEFESTVIISPDKPAATAETDKPRQYAVTVVNGPKAGEQIPLSKPYTTLGKPGVQVAVVARRGKDYYLMPMSGTTAGNNNPPRLNGMPLASQSQLLNEGDTIEVAGITLKYGVLEEDQDE